MAQELERNDVDSFELPQASGGPDLLGIVLRRKWHIALGVVVGLALGYFYYLRQPPVYQSAAQVLVVRKRTPALPIQGMEGQMASYYEDYLATHVVLMRSPLIAGRAAKKRQLQSLRSFAKTGDPTRAIIGALSVAREEAKSSILNLTWRGPVADDCGSVLNALIESYSDFLGETYQDVSDKTVEFIVEAKDELAKELEQKERNYLEFQRESPLLRMGKERTNIHQERLGGIESVRMGLLVRRAETAARLKLVETALEVGDRSTTARAMAATPLQSVSGSKEQANPELRMEAELFPLLVQERILLEDYGPDHPKVYALHKQIELTREFYLAQSEDPHSIDRYVQSLKQDLDDSRALEASLTEFFEEEREAAIAITAPEIEEETLRKDLYRTQALYDGVIKRLQEVDLVKDYGGYTTQVISPAGPGSQIAPKASKILAVAAFLGVLGGFGLAYLVDISDKSFRTPEEIRRRLGLPVVGHIPFLKPRPEQEVEAEANGKSLDAALCTYHRPKSRDSEAYRGVRTALYFSTRGEGHKVIQITSPGPGDGKTTLAANLAISIAQSGKRTLLIDADFRRPRVHKVFGLDSKVGLASVFLGEAEITDAIQQTVIPNLWALPCGPHPPNPAELLTSERFAEVLLVLREKYDFVVIDTPPLLVVTDPCAVAPRVDGVILTIRVSKNGRPDAERAKEILATLGAKVIGVVVNCVVDQGGNGYGYGRYGYRYGGYRYGYGGYRYGQDGYGYGYGYGAPYDSNGSGGDGDEDGYYQSEDEEQEKTTDVETGDAQSTEARTTTGSRDSEEDGSKRNRSETARRPKKRGSGFLGWFRNG